MKVRFKCPAEFAAQKDAFGYGRVYRALSEALANRDDLTLVGQAKDADVQVTYCQPLNTWKVFHWWGRDKHENEILYTTWETTQIPETWLQPIERFRAIATPSRWNTETLQSCGVDKLGFVIRHGVEADKFPLIDRSFENSESRFWPGKKFAFLWEGMAMNDRKGRRYVREAFKRLLAIYPDIWLVEKIYPFASMDGPPDLCYTDEHITQIRRFMEFDEYLDLAASCHGFIYPSRGEAFGLMPLEKLATGMAVATTNWSGQTEYLDDRFFWPIKFDMSEKGQDFFATVPFLNFQISPGQDSVPKVDDVFAAMKSMYENRAEWRERGIAGSKWVHENWTWRKAADDFAFACKSMT